jgi:GH25 family lysozyme M1 (1,4-beta-N-acetylmuramidase)
MPNNRPFRPQRFLSRRLIPAAAALVLLAVGAAAAGASSASASPVPVSDGPAHAPAPAPAAARAAALAAAAKAGKTATPATDAASGPSRQALDLMTGKMVTVYKVTHTTPVHPEKLTHPDKDYMGTVTAEHGGGKGKNASATASAASSKPAAAAVSGLPGIDVSAYQGNITWSSIASSLDFVYAKATEGTYYTNPDFSNQYEGPYDEGIIRGAYHFGIPDNSTGAAQADYFAHNGGGWSADGLTLPGVLDIEYNPYGDECYDLSKASMTSWIWDFVNEYAYDTGVYPVIYTTDDWWTTCTSSDSGFASYDPLWIADYNSTAGTLPAGYGYYTFWQYADSGSLPGDQDVFNGAYSRLQALALG